MKLGIKSILKNQVNKIKVKGKPKIFCIGKNKTGTTSLKHEFLNRGFIVGNQKLAQQKLREPYYNNNFQPIIQYCKSAQVFQDIPFSWPKTYKELDKAFPGSKFILSIRDEESWYKSLVNHMAKMVTNGERIPTADDLKTFKNGYYWKGMSKQDHFNEKDPLNKETQLNRYNQYNNEVIDYFKDRDDLIVVDVSKQEDYTKFCEFFNFTQTNSTFPWKNKANPLNKSN